MFKDMFLETDRLILRPFTLDDLYELHKIVSQEEVMKFLPEGVLTLEETKKILVWLIDCYEKNTQDNIIKFTVGVLYKEENKLIGWCGLGPLEFNKTEIEIYYGLSQEYWGKGFAPEAAKAMLNYGFTVIGLDKIVAVVTKGNLASKRVLKKMGMIYRKEIKNLPAEYRPYEGDFYYCLIREEYDKITNM